MDKTVNRPHVNGYTFLCFVAGELDELGARRVERHVEDCPPCRRELHEIRWLDHELAARREAVFQDGTEKSLPVGDPFAGRPSIPPRRASRYGFQDPSFTLRWAAAAQSAAPIRDMLLAAESAVLGRLLERELKPVAVRKIAEREALEEAPRRVAEGAARYRPLADLSLERLDREPVRPFHRIPVREMTEAEFACPLAEVVARASLLDGVICNWTGEYDRGGRSLLRAWNGFADGAASELPLAVVELHESQRRTFSGDPSGGLILAQRSLKTCEETQSEVDAARARFAIGVALGALDRHEEALELFRKAADDLADLGNWNAYGSAISCLGSSLLELGRLDDARREYARALKVTTKGNRPGNRAFLTQSLGRLMFRSGDYKRAAAAFQTAAEFFGKLGMVSDEAVLGLHLAECLVRIGKTQAARACVRDVEEKLRHVLGLDPAILRELRIQLSGEKPDFEVISALRDRAEEAIRLKAVRG